MSDSDKLDRTRVDQLGLTDSINDDDKFIVSQRVEDDSDGNEQNATNIANFSTICGHVAESDPVVNKMLEIHYQVPHDGFPGSVKPGFGIDMQGDGTLDNALYMNKNLVFCGDDLSAGWLYNEKTGQYYKPNNLDLPMGMSYLRTSVHDGIEPSRTVATQVLDEQTYLGADFNNDTWVNKSAKLGKYFGENGDLGIPNDKSYNGSNNAYAPFPEPIVEHVIEWTNIGLAVNQWYTTGFSGKNPFETIILCRVAARASVSTLDPERRSLTITFKTRERDKQIASGSNFYYFKATLGPNDTEATLMSDTGEKLGRIIVRDYDNIIWSENLDKIHHKSTGMIKNNNQGNDRLLAWQIGLKRAGASGPPGGSTASSEDTFVDITKFLNGILVVVGIKVEYGEQSTGFDKTYLHDFSSKDMVVNQATDLAIYNTLVRETEKSMERMDYLETLGKFPDIIFQKNRPARLVGANLENTEASNAWQNSDNNHNMRINLDLTSSSTEVWLNVARWLGAAGGSIPGTLFEDSYGQTYEAATIINSDFAPPNGPGVILDQNSAFDDSSNLNYPVRGKSVYNDEQIQENLKIANQAFSGNITINSENFELKDRFVKCATGGWKVEETGRETVMWPSEDDPEARERVKSITYRIKCPEANLPVFSKVKDMLTLKPAGNLNLGGVRIGANSGLTVDASGSLGFNAGSGLTIDPNTGVVSVTGGGGASSLDDLTDVSIIAPTVGQALVFNGTGWENDDVSGGSSSLSELNDVAISSPSDKQGLVYDAQSGNWINGDSSGFALDKVASGSVVSFNDGADDLPVLDLTAQITAVQSGSGDPSPSNIRPISGFTGVNVKRTGINFFDEVTEQGSIDITTGQNVYVNNRLRSKNYLPVKGGQTYRIYLSGSSTLWMAILTYDANKNFLANLGGKTGNSTITLDSNVCYLRFYLDSGYGLTYNNDISINYPSTDTSYHAYNGQTYSVTWQTEAGTVYGGSIDLTTGLLTVTHGRADLGSLLWTKNSTYGVFLTTSLNGVNTEYNALCEIYRFAGQVTSAQGAYQKGDKTFSILTNDARHIIYIRDDSFSDSDTFTEAVNGHYLVYELATPQTYQLTPTEVKTLLGNNTIVADTGNVSVDYQTEQASDIIDLVGEGGASDLADLGDVDLTTPTDGQVLTYDATAGKWKNHSVSAQDVVAQKALFGDEITITDGVPNSYINEAVLKFHYTKSSTGGVAAFVPCSGVDLYCQSSLKSLTFPQALYKGTADFISGRIEEEAGAMTITTSTMNSTYTSVFAKAMTDTNFVNSVEAFFDADIYDYVPFTNFADMQDRTISAYYGDWNGTTRLWIVWKDTRYTTNSQMTTALASNPINVIGELRTRQTYSVQGHSLQIDPVSSITMLTTSDGTLKVSYISNDVHSIIAEVQNQTGIEDLSGASIISPQEGQVLVFKDQLWKNVNIPTPWTDVIGTLTAGNTSITLQNAAITTSSTIEVYTEPEIPHNSTSASTGSVTVTFDSQSADVKVKVRIT